MLNTKGQRELCYAVKVTNITPIEGADRVELAHVNGWQVMVKKGEYKIGDLAVYFEIDSKLPETEPFEFMAKYKYRVKTQKFIKGSVWSQGLIMTPAELGLKDVKEGDFLTDKLGITYYEVEDNIRKADNKKLAELKADKFMEKWAKEHKFLFRFAFIRKWRRKKFLKKYFAKQKKTGDWPFWVTKTDEERIQNLPAIFIDNHKKYWITEKIDGTSTTFTMAQAPKKKRHAIICSRNVVFNTPEKEKQNYYKDTDGNVYVEMFEKYDINKVLNYILDEHPDYEFITIQGETYGGTIQKRKYCENHRFAIFNYIYKKKGEAPVRLNPGQMYDRIKTINLDLGTNLETVPILGQMTLEGYDCDMLLKYAEGISEIDKLPREGLVFRDMEGKESFKAVSNSFLEKYHS